MKRRTLDILFSFGGVAITMLLLVLGLVLSSNASFSKSYVTDQLSQQKITFKAADTLTDEEKQSACLVANAGKPLTTGKQAECYANDFIGLHVKSIAGAEGLTYSEIGGKQGQLRAAIKTATAANDPGLADLEKQLEGFTAARETVFKGEMLRGALLSSFGFSVLGEKAGQGATVAYLGAILMGLLSIAGFIHAFVIPKNKPFAVPETMGSFTKEHKAS